MRKYLAILAVCMVVLAGCSTGDTTGTPTLEANETETGKDTMNNATPGGEMETESDSGGMNTSGDDTTPADASAVPGVEGSELTAPTELVLAFSRSLDAGPVDFETTYRPENLGATSQFNRYTFRIRNDTQQQQYVLNSSNQQVTYYIDGESAAVRNDTTGEVLYSNQTNAIRSEATGTSVYALNSITYISALEWEATGTTTVHGEEHYVLESTGPNATSLAQSPLSANSITSTDGRMVVGVDGIIHNGTVDIDGETAINVSFSTRIDDSITVESPSWYNDSEANNQS